MLLSTTGCSINKSSDKNSDSIVVTPTQDTSVEESTATGSFGEIMLKEEADRKAIAVSYEEIKINPNVKSYNVESDLTNIANLSEFGSFTNEQKALLSQNGFVVCPTSEEQLFYIYENNEYKKIPSFITTDSVLQVYHIFYDYSLRTLENEKLLPQLEELTDSMLNKSILLYNNLTDENIKGIELKNIAYFAVAEELLGKELPDNIPDAAKKLAKQELELIKAESGFNPSVIFGFDMDYSQYTPRGHYTRSDDLKRYFKTMMWYGQAPFPLYTQTGERNIDQTIQALLVTYSLFIKNEGLSDYERWENIYDPTVFYVGSSDDLTVYQYRDLLVKAYGTKPDLNKLKDQDKLDLLYKEADKFPEPAIQAKYTSVNTPVGKQFRFMGQRFIPDSEVIQEFIEPIKRPIPSGLDVMAVLGSSRAYKLQTEKYKVQDKLPTYPQIYQKYKKKFDELSLDKWQSNMYYGWLWVLRDIIKPVDKGYPSFMQNDAWADKSLSTALGSWAELRHDSILYGKQSGAECGGGEEPPQIKGYVEPNVETYNRLLWLTKYSRENLSSRDMLTDSMKNKLQTFENLLQFLINCSVKELNNEELTSDEYYQLLVYGGMLEYLTSSFAGDGMRWFEITSDTDKNMAVIADIHTIAPNEYSNGGYYEVGVGPAYEIYVVVPIAGKLYLTRGAVFSYYEFDFSADGKRLTDEEWQKMLKNNKQPAQPDWMKSFINDIKNEVPMPANPYSTGC
jgi:hypothetical protein